MGICVGSISPSIGVELCGYGYYLERRNKGVHDDLKVRCLHIVSPEEHIILVNADLLGFSEKVIERTRREISEKLDVPAENIIFTATHTHSGPAVPSLEASGEVDETYIDFLIRKVCEVCTSPPSMSAVKIGVGEGALHGIAYNRVFKDGPIDRSVRVVSFKGDSSFHVVLFNYSCHAVTIDVRTEDARYVSADWPGYAMRQIDREFSCTSLFLQGTCGDIDPLIAWHRMGFEAAEKVGFKVGKRVIDIVKKVSYQDISNFSFSRRIVSLSYQKINAEYLVTDAIDFLKEIEKEDDSNIRRKIRFERIYLSSMLKKLDALPKALNVEFYGLRFNDVAMLFLPGEISVEIGLEIMENSPFSHTLVVGYSGAYIGYIPIKREYEKKTYAAYIVPKIALSPPYTDSVGEIFVREALQLLSEL